MEAAAAAESFSIRGYAARMRAVDAAKCWPFGGDAAPLPPMPVPRFRWWAHELPPAPGEEEQVGAGGEEAKGNGGDLRVRKRSRANCGAERAKKRRQLQIRISLKHKEKNHKHPSTSSLCISRSLQPTWHTRLSRKILNSTAHARRKKLAAINKLSDTKGIILSQNNSFTTKNKKRGATDNPVDGFLGKMKISSLVKKPSLKANKSASSTLKPCDVKKHVTFSAKDDIFGDLPLLESSKIMFSNECDELPTGMEVSFVASQSKTDIMAETASLKLVPASGTRDHMSAVEDTTNKSSSDKERTCIFQNKQLTDVCSHPLRPGLLGPMNYSTVDVVKHCFGESVDLNHVTQEPNLYSLCPGNASSPFVQFKSSDVPALSSYPDEGSKSGFNTPAKECFRVSTRCSQDNSVPVVSTSSTSSSMLSSRIEVSWKEINSSADANINTKISDLEAPPKCHLPAKDRTLSSTSPHRTVNVVINTNDMHSCRNLLSSEDCVSLPSYPNEEIFKTSSDCLGDNERVRHDHIAKHSVFSFPGTNCIDNAQSSIANVHTESTDQGASLLVEDQGSWYSKLHPVSTPACFGLAFMKIPGFERMEISSSNPWTNEDNSVHCGRPMNTTSYGEQGQASTSSNCQQEQTRISYNTQREHARISSSAQREQTRIVNHKSQVGKTSFGGYVRQNAHHPNQPTMRLMGKTVIVCKHSQEHGGLTNGKVWADKMIIAGGSYPTTIPGQLLQKELVAHQDLETSRRHGIQSSEVSSRFSDSTAIKTRLNNGNFHSQAQLPSISSVSSSIQNYKVNTCSSSSPETVLNKASVVSVNLTNRSRELEHQLLSAASYHHNRGLPFATSTSPTCRGYQNFVGLASDQSSPSIPQQIINTKVHQKYQKSALRSYDDPSSIPICQPGPGLGTKSSSTSIISFVDYSISNAQPINAASLLHPSLTSTNLASKSISTVNTTCTGTSVSMNNMMREHTKGFEYSNQSNKSVAGADDLLLRPAKKPHILKKQAVVAPTALKRRDHFYGWLPNDPVSPQILDFGSRMGEVCACVPCTENNGLRIDTGLNSAVETRSRPVRLSAGAIHVLEPGQNSDQDNSRPIYSTIKFTVENGVNSVVS